MITRYAYWPLKACLFMLLGLLLGVCNICPQLTALREVYLERWSLVSAVQLTPSSACCPHLWL